MRLKKNGCKPFTDSLCLEFGTRKVLLYVFHNNRKFLFLSLFLMSPKVSVLVEMVVGETQNKDC
jgi:hypothetical protein